MKTSLELREGLRSFPPSPVVLVSMEYEGKKNIITLGMVQTLSSNPPLVGIGVAPARFSHQLIAKSEEFVINIPNGENLKAVRICGDFSGKDIDKFEKSGLTPIRGEKVGAPLIKECPANLECKLVKFIDLGDHTWFIGRVLAAHRSSEYDRERLLMYGAGEYRTLSGLKEKR